MIGIARLSTRDADFDTRLAGLLAFENTQDQGVEDTVAAILREVKARGDDAVLEYTRKFDQLEARSLAELEIGKAELERALAAQIGRAHV